MSKKNVYDYFIGLLALMLAFMLVIDLFLNIPNEVKWSFYYIDNIVRGIFIIDLIITMVIKKNGKNTFIHNMVDIASIIPLSLYIKVLNVIHLISIIRVGVIVKCIQVFMLIILLAKFRIRVKDQIKQNSFNLLLILSTIIIVIGAVAISLIEGITIGDALWWSFVTFTTVGYGDILLKTQLGRVVAVLLMLFGIGVIGVATTTMALLITNGRKEKKKLSYKDKIVNDIKERLNDYEDLTDEEIDSIAKLLKSLKD